MSQQYQSIGTASSDLERVAGERQGWEDAGDPAQRAPEPPVQEITDASDYSFYDDRANYQALGHPRSTAPGYPIPNMAGYEQPNMAGYTVQPAAGAHPAQRAPARKRVPGEGQHDPMDGHAAPNTRAGKAGGVPADGRPLSSE